VWVEVAAGFRGADRRAVTPRARVHGGDAEAFEAVARARLASRVRARSRSALRASSSASTATSASAEPPGAHHDDERLSALRRSLRVIDTATLMAVAEDPDAPVPEIVGGKEFLIPPSEVLAHSMDEVDQSLPATRSSVESDKFLENADISVSGDDVAHGSKAEEWEAALIITGTAVGGGSLALPYFCAAGGFFPALAFLLVAYGLLLGSALVLVEPTIRVWEDNPSAAVSMHSVVRTYLGERWGLAAGVTFWVLINCTLVSQLAKCGELTAVFAGFDVAGAGAGAGAGRTGFGSVVSARSPPRSRSRSPRSTRTWGRSTHVPPRVCFLGFLLALVFGIGGVNPSLLVAGNLVAAAPALPAIAQTMTYAEAIPTVVDMCRGSRVKVRRVLALGSLGPAVMYALWLAVTLGRASLADFAASGGDLAAKILAEGGPLGCATAAIATCASVSTLIGCYLALSRFHADTFKLNLSRRNVKLVGITVLPSLLLSMKGPEMYHLMIKFAGTVPVAFLWGVMPPLVYWKMLKGEGKLTVRWAVYLALGTLGSALAMAIGARSM
jgi:amino acid permease